MIEQVSTAMVAIAFFQDSTGTGVAGLTVTYDIDRIVNNAGTPTITSIVTGGSATGLGKGYYGAPISAANNSAEGEYVILFKTVDVTVQAKQIPSLWSVQVGGIENLDLSISAVDVDVWNEPLPGAYVAGQAGYIVGTNLDIAVSAVDLDVVDNILGAAVPDGYPAGSLGYVIGNNLDTPVSGAVGGDEITIIADGMRFRNFGSQNEQALNGTVFELPIPNFANAVKIQAVGANIYFTDDGTEPSATHGWVLYDTETWRVLDLNDYRTGETLNFLRAAGGASIRYQWLRQD